MWLSFIHLIPVWICSDLLIIHLAYLIFLAKYGTFVDFLCTLDCSLIHSLPKEKWRRSLAIGGSAVQWLVYTVQSVREIPGGGFEAGFQWRGRCGRHQCGRNNWHKASEKLGEDRNWEFGAWSLWSTFLPYTVTTPGLKATWPWGSSPRWSRTRCQVRWRWWLQIEAPCRWVDSHS